MDSSKKHEAAAELSLGAKSRLAAALLPRDDRGADTQQVPWVLIVVLALFFVVVWLFPPLGVLKQSENIFPLTLHSVEETFSFLVSLLVFAVSWNAYSRERAGNVMILACGFLAVGLLDFGHMLSYQGMPLFVTPASPQKAIVFWLAARYVAAITLLVIALRPWVPLSHPLVRFQFLAVSLLLTAAVFLLELNVPELWPVMFIPGQGLTPIKISAEYGIIALLGVTAVILYRKSQVPQSFDAANLFTATLITILSELCFTLYSNVNDVFQLMGHTYKVIAYFCIYRAVFVS
ncbi:MAG TPA: MASE3 domain-containing protein, partial [Azospira sp.]|nr:MASE3 domain-containing protein [Azospira sp.]